VNRLSSIGQSEASWFGIDSINYHAAVDLNFLQALDSDGELFDAERNLTQTKRDELLSLVQLYEAELRRKIRCQKAPPTKGARTRTRSISMPNV
jgi:hypothetical protein